MLGLNKENMAHLKAIIYLRLQNYVEKLKSPFLYVDYTAGGKHEFLIGKLSTNTK